MGKVRTTFTKDIKIKAVRMYVEEGLGTTTIAKELGISTHKIICRWIKHYENEGLEGLEEKRGKTSGFRKGCSRKNPLTLEERVVRLEAENEYLKKWLSHLRG